MDLSAPRPLAATNETVMDRDIPVEGETQMDMAAGAALRVERSASPAVGMNGTPQVMAPAVAAEGGPEPVVSSGCTQAQLRRFIKSRPYVPMHELRRRFELNGAADEVSVIRVADGTVYVGLGARESDFIAELVRQGDIGVELCHDPPVPMVVGVYAMRPISR
jgi:hypothetical protein